MPWRSMNQERLDFAHQALAQKRSFLSICESFGISRKTGYKWLNRFQEDGKFGLNDRSRAPINHPNAISPLIVEFIISIRSRWPEWGPKKISSFINDDFPELSSPSLSTISSILEQHYLSKSRRPGKHLAETSPLADCINANDVWTQDFKGWFITGDRKKCIPYTITDGHSRFCILCKSMNRTTGEMIWVELEKAFYEYGLPKRLRSDNGPPFASMGAGRLSRLAIKLVKAGITPEWIAPGKPQQNGRHERFHLTLKNEVASPPAETLKGQEILLKEFQFYYNYQRPHEALGQKPPAEFYTPSRRRWDGILRSPEYPENIEKRKVMKCGSICFASKDYFLSESLYGEYVGLEEIGNGLIRISFGPIVLGTVDLRKGYRRK